MRHDQRQWYIHMLNRLKVRFVYQGLKGPDQQFINEMFNRLTTDPHFEANQLQSDRLEGLYKEND